MKDVEIKKYYRKKIKELKNHNKFYFEKNSPKISDSQYDKIKLEILDLEKKICFFKKRFISI